LDADNHYYESEDCFTRFGDEEIERFVKWYSQGKKRFLAFGQTFQTMVPNRRSIPSRNPASCTNGSESSLTAANARTSTTTTASDGVGR